MKIIFWLIVAGVVGFIYLAYLASEAMNVGCDEEPYIPYIHCL